MAIGTRFRDVDKGDPVRRGMMIIYALALLLALIKIADWVAPYENLTEDGCTLNYIYDGDTVAIDCNGEVETARLVGFDTPEAKDPRCAAEADLAQQATQRLRDLAAKGAVTFSGGDFDKYGRLLVTMRVDGVNVKETLVDEGYAVEYSGGRRISWCAKLEGA